MSDFMRAVVEEALRKRTPARPYDGTEAFDGKKASDSKEASDSKKASNSTEAFNVNRKSLQSSSLLSGIAGIARPNYQNEKRLKRLSPEGQEHESDNPLSQSAAGAASGMTEQFVTQALSPLLRLSLIPGKTTVTQDKDSESEAAECTIESTKCSGMLGQFQDGLGLWFYPDLHPKLASELGIYGSVPPVVGIVTAGYCLPSQLLILDKLVSTTSLRSDVKWSRDNGSEFYVRLSGNEQDAPILLSVLKQWRDRHQQQSERAITFHELLEPSMRIAKLLGAAHGEGLAVVEGLSRLRSVALLDRCFKKGLSSRLRYRIENRYLIVTGEPDEIREASSVMLSISEPYLR
ncbi:hypothetical protein D3C74_252160 [compost metagenome]